MNLFKRLLAGMAAGAMALSLIAMQEETVVFQNSVSASTLGNLTYEIVDDEIMIVNCDKSAISVEIPSEIEGYPVTMIDDFSFSSCYYLTEVIIPDSVISIGWYAFRYCESLTEVEIPDSVISIDDGAFSNCSNLTKAVISSSVERIGMNVFSFCDSLTSITVDSENPYFCDIDGVLLSKDKANLLVCPPGKSELIIPNSVLSIGDKAFYSCLKLTKIEIPDSVSKIGMEAFEFCPSLKTITVDINNPYYCDVDGVLFNKDKTTIITYPSSREDTSYIIPDSVTAIGDSAFFLCWDLVDIVIPDSVTSIGNDAFLYCLSLTGVVIPESVTTIKDAAFSYCESLTEITLPDSVSNIGMLIFSECKSLTKVTISNSITEITWSMFSYCTNLTEVVIPDSVVMIDSSAFSGCTSLSSVSIANSVTSIGERAFYDCTSLNEVTIPASVTIINDKAFGFHYDRETYASFKKDSFTILGYDDSVAEVYANEHSFDFVSLGEIPEISSDEASGDPSGDGKITAEDALLILQFTAESYDFTDEQLNAADVSGDGEVNALDALLILQYEAELISEFPKG